MKSISRSFSGSNLSCLQKDDFVVAIKVIAKKNLSKTQNLLAKEIKILKVRPVYLLIF